MPDLTLIIITVATAVLFDYTNGFHDTANAMATTIATRALPPRIAVGLASILNFAGAFISVTVAATIASGIVDQELVTVPIVFAGLLGAILWNVITWYFGIPSSSSHALIGGVVGSMLAPVGSGAVLWDGIAAKVIILAVLAPFICGGAAYLATRLSYRLTRRIPEEHVVQQMVAAWILTLPAAGLMGAAAHEATTLFSDDTVGVIVVGLVGLAIGVGLFLLARRDNVTSRNVVAEPATPRVPARAGAPA